MDARRTDHSADGGKTMKRTLTSGAILLIVALATPVLQADVKTRDRSTFALEGFLGGVVRLFGGRGAREGVETTVAIKGNRKSMTSGTNAQIVDLAEERIYLVDTRRREYRVRTFADIRAEFEKAKADAERQAAQAKPEDKEQLEQAARELDIDVDVQETGQRRSLLGHDTREVILTLTAREKGRTLEQSGGFVLTNTLWLAPRLAAVDELTEFELKFIRAVYGESFLGDMQQMAGMMALYPAFSNMARRLGEESRKLAGTPLSTTMTFESVRSEEQMKAAAEANQSSGGGGIGGMLGRRIMGNRAAPQARAKILTTTHEMLSVETAVTDADVTIPTNFREQR
jgi:hypothetical protein